MLQTARDSEMEEPESGTPIAGLLVLWSGGAPRPPAGDPPPRPGERDEAWELTRRRWRRDLPTPVVERVRSPGSEPREEATPAAEPPQPQLALAIPAEEPVEEPVRPRSRLGGNRLIAPAAGDRAAIKKPAGPVAEALARGLALARRRAAAQALSETLRQQPADAPLLPLWNLLAEKNLPEALTIGDLVAAVRNLPG